MITRSFFAILSFCFALFALVGCTSPYPLSYSVQWPYLLLWPSSTNHTGMKTRPQEYSFSSQDKGDTISIVFVGDIMVRDGDRVLTMSSGVRKALDDADLIIANCEAPVIKEEKDKNRKHWPTSFEMPVQYLRDVTGQAGSSWVLSIANNHIGDQGRSGFNRTLAVITNSTPHRYIGFYPLQPDDSWPTFTIGDLRVGVVAWTRWLNKEKELIDAPRVYRHEDIFLDSGHSRLDWNAEKQKNNIDLIIGYPHWEYEFQHFPHEDSITHAENLLAAGMDLIVGSHPHTLQAMDWFDGKICLYSLGNFNGFNNDFVDWLGDTRPTRMSALFTVRIARESDGQAMVTGYTLHPTIQSNNGTNTVQLLSEYQGEDKDYYGERLELMYQRKISANRISGNDRRAKSK